MGRIEVRKDILYAFLIAVVIHVGIANTHIAVSRPAVTLRAERNRFIEIAFVSSFEEVKEKAAAKPVIRKKKAAVRKKEREKKKVLATEPLKKVEEERIETQSIEKPVAATRPSSSLVAKPRETPAVFSAVPRYEENMPPAYPRIARRRGYEGTVMLSALILTDGTVGELIVNRSSGHTTLDRAAVKAVKKWKFTPATRMGVSFTMWVDVPVRFVIKKSE